MDIRIFMYGSNQVRTIQDKQDNPWWVAKDVCEALGYVWNGTARIAHVPEEWRGVTSVVTPSGEQEMAVLSEQGLYFFLGRSDKEKALPFQKWIAGEVIPSIRKRGVYATPLTIERIIADPDVMIGLCRELKKERAEKEKLASENVLMTPKAEFYDAVTGSKTAIDIGRVAKVLNFRNVGRNTLFKILRDKGILMPGNVPYQKYIDRGYFRTIEQKYMTPEGETRISIKTVVFQKGIDFIRKQLLKHGFEMQNVHAVEVVS